MGLATYTYNRSTSGGEIITHLVNSSDGQGLDFANGALLQLEYEAGGVFGTSDFSIEFIIDQSSGNSNSKILYTSGGNNEFQITNESWWSKIELTFDGADYDFSYDMFADYGSPVHYVMTFDRDDVATLYKDGNSVATVDISGSSAVDLDNSGTAAGYLGGVSDYGVTGVFYRWRTWKKLLSAAEVTACYENTSVPITDQWSNCVTDLDFAFANPEMSLQIQSRSGAGDATASVGVSQVTPIEQLNSKSVSVSNATQRTPANGDIVADQVGVGIVPTVPLDVSNGYVAFKIGADSNVSTRTNVTDKHGRIGSQHYTNAEEPVGIAYVKSTNTENSVRIGGGSGYLNAATDVKFYTAANATTTTGTERLTIDSAGRVGVGCTPEAWSSGRSVIQLGGGGVLLADDDTTSNYMNMGVNMYHDGAWKRINAGYANRVQCDQAGIHLSISETTDAADSAITFVKALTCDTAGFVGIGGTPSAPLHVYQTAADDNDTAVILETANAAERTRLLLRNGSAIDDFVFNLKSNGMHFGWASSLEEMTISSAGLCSFTNGINLGNTASATATTLDGYEEGVHQTTVTCSTSGTVTLNAGYDELGYTRIGRMVFVTGYLLVDSVSSPVGYMKISLPFSSANAPQSRASGVVTVHDTVGANISDFVQEIHQNVAFMRVYLGDATGVQSDSAEQMQATTNFRVSCFYYTDDAF